MSHRQRNRKRNHYHISYWWRVDFEKVKDKLLDKGLVQVEYACCNAYWHTFTYDKA